ncbi:MAG: RNA 2'-phosphotransferase [Candidatus Hodarchaeales archaeon]
MSNNIEENEEKIIRNRRISRLSKFLTLLLRHRPELLDMRLDESGWSDISINEIAERLSKAENDKFNWVIVKDIEDVVNTDPKGRYEISKTEPRVLRASYGHSIQTINLLSTPSSPEELPSIAFYGCSQSEIGSILRLGINTSERQNIHLSVRKNDALAIARKKFSYGPRIVSIDLSGVANSGIPCKSITPHVIIVESIPSQFISEIPVPERYSQGPRRGPYRKPNFQSSGHPSTFQSRGGSRDTRGSRGDSKPRTFPKSKSQPPPSSQGRQKNPRKPQKSEKSDDFDDKIEFVFKKKNKDNPLNDVEITDDDFNFEMD